MFHRRVRRLEIDESATLTILRDGERREVTVTLERTRLTPEEARRDRNRDFDLSVREITFFDRDENRWPQDIKGVLVEQVERAGWAGLAGIRGRDLIQRVGDHPVTGIKSYRKAMEAVAKEQPERLVMVVLRGVRTHFVFLEPDWRPISDNKPEQDKE